MFLEFTSCTTVVAACAKSQIGSSSVDEATDAAISLTIEGSTVGQIGAAREHKQRTGRGPGLFEQDVGSDWNNGVGGGQEATEGIEAVTHTLDRRSITCSTSTRPLIIP